MLGDFDFWRNRAFGMYFAMPWNHTHLTFDNPFLDAFYEVCQNEDRRRALKRWITLQAISLDENGFYARVPDFRVDTVVTDENGVVCNRIRVGMWETAFSLEYFGDDMTFFYMTVLVGPDRFFLEKSAVCRYFLRAQEGRFSYE